MSDIQILPAETLDISSPDEEADIRITASSILDLELECSPDQTERLPRLAPLSRQRLGRMRTRSFRRIWHDTPDAAFFERSLALIVEGQIWRLESIATPPDRPGTVQEPLAQAATIDALPRDDDTSGSVMPLASAEGRQRIIVLAAEGSGEEAALTVTIEDGSIRNLTDTLPFARMHLHGPADAVALLAKELLDSNAARFKVPAVPLSMLAIAHGRALPPKPATGLGAPAVEAGMSTEEAAQHIFGHLTTALLYWAPRIRKLKTGEIDKSALEPVHQIRVTLRRLRSALSLFSPVVACPEVETVKAGLKTIGTLLGPARDWDVFLSETGQTLLDAFPENPGVQRLLERAAQQRDMHYRALLDGLAAPDFDMLGLSLALLCHNAPWRQTLDGLEESERQAKEHALDQPVEHFAATVLKRRLRKLPANAPIADMPTVELHELRLHAKRLRYACEFFAACFAEKSARRMIRRLSELQEALGILNDGAVASGLMQELDGKDGTQGAQARGIVLGFAAAHGISARQDILSAWEYFHEAKPFWH